MFVNRVLDSFDLFDGNLDSISILYCYINSDYKDLNESVACDRRFKLSFIMLIVSRFILFDNLISIFSNSFMNILTCCIN